MNVSSLNSTKIRPVGAKLLVTHTYRRHMKKLIGVFREFVKELNVHLKKKKI
jgi:hypothetical protein